MSKKNLASDEDELLGLWEFCSAILFMFWRALKKSFARKSVRATLFGFSLLFALPYMVVLMVISVQSVEDSQRTAEAYRLMDAQMRSTLMSKDGRDIGLSATRTAGPGFEVNEEYSRCVGQEPVSYPEDTMAAIMATVEAQRPENNEDCVSWSHTKVYAKAQENDLGFPGDHYIPIPGTGDAFKSKTSRVCSILKADLHPDHSCNWAKLRPEQSITIPLYTTDSLGDVDFPSLRPDFTGWKLRMRTPCVNGSDAADCDDQNPETEDIRYELDGDGTDMDGDRDVTDDDESIVFWQLHATFEDPEGAKKTVTLIPNDAYGRYESLIKSRESLWDPLLLDNLSEYDPNAPKNKNTEIYESLVNEQNDVFGEHVVLEANSSHVNYDELYDFMIGENAKMDPLWTMKTLELSFTPVAPLIEYGTDYKLVPYLEWQLVTDADHPFTNIDRIAIGEGFHRYSKWIFFRREIEKVRYPSQLYSPFVLAPF